MSTSSETVSQSDVNTETVSTSETITEQVAPPAVAVVSPTPVAFTDIQELSNDLLDVKTITIDARGKSYEFVIRSLNSETVNQAERLLDFYPPMVERIVDGKKTPEFDTLDAGYTERKAKAKIARRALLIAKSLALEIPGANQEEKQKWLEQNLPDWLLARLEKEIEAISASDVRVVELANFSLSADSPKS